MVKAKKHIISSTLWILFLAICLIFMMGFSGIKLSVVLSGSMEPALPTGSLIIIDTENKNPATGDIINYMINGTSVTHRVAGIANGLYKTKGDANKTLDFYYVYPEQILGSVLFHIPFAGYMVGYLKKSKILFFLCILTIVINQIEIMKKRRKRD